MVHRIFRVSFGGGLGFVLGAAVWIQLEYLRMFGPGPEGTLFEAGLLGTLLGSGFVVLTDLLGLDLPIFPEGNAHLARVPWGSGARAPSEGSGSVSLPPSTASDDDPLGLRPTLARLRDAQIQLGLLGAGMVLTLFGLLLDVIRAGSAGVLGSRDAGLGVLLLAYVPYAIAFWRGGTIWRVVTVATAAATTWVIFELRA